MRSETVKYSSDGVQMHSELFCAEGGAARRPGVLVFPEVFGLGEHALTRARQLAERGYAALACDLHGERRMIQDMQQVMGFAGALRQDPARVRARARAALEALVARSEVDATRVAAIGYCFGGTMALELARSGAELVGVVGFHSGLATAASDAPVIRGRVLVCIGADDPSIPAEQRVAFEQEMRGAGVDWQMHLYGKVVHSFTNPGADRVGRPDFARYDKRADARSWRAMCELFDEVFAEPR